MDILFEQICGGSSDNVSVVTGTVKGNIAHGRGYHHLRVRLVSVRVAGHSISFVGECFERNNCVLVLRHSCCKMTAISNVSVVCTGSGTILTSSNHGLNPPPSGVIGSGWHVFGGKCLQVVVRSAGRK